MRLHVKRGAHVARTLAEQRRHRQLLFATWVGSLAALVTVILGLLLPNRGSKAPSSTPHSGSSSELSPGSSVGPRLATKITYGASGAGWAVGFPIGDTKAQKYYAWTALPEDLPEQFLDELRAGGYALGGLAIDLTVQPASNRPVAVTDMHLDLQRSAPPTGIGVIIGTQGTVDDAAVGFDISTGHASQPRQLGVGGVITATDFFRGHTITASRTNPAFISIYTNAPPTTMTGTLTLDFEQDGQTYSQVVADDSVVRVGPPWCTRKTERENYTLSPVLFELGNETLAPGPAITPGGDCSVRPFPP